MADSQSASQPQPEEMHWIALRMDVQEVRQDIRELRSEASDFRKEMAQHLGELRQDIRHSLMAMLGFSGVLAAIMIAFIQYRVGGN